MQRIPPIREVPSFEGSEDTSSESHSLYGFDRDVLGVRSVSPEELSDSAGYMTGVSDSSLGEDDGDPARQYRFFEREINLFRNREHNVYITPPLDHTNLLRMVRHCVLLTKVLPGLSKPAA